MSTATLERSERKTYSGPTYVWRDGRMVREEVTDAPLTGWLAIPDETGDTKIIWDKDDPDSIAAAEAMFDKCIERGMAIFDIADDEGKKGKQVRKFNPATERLMAVKQQKGG